MARKKLGLGCQKSYWYVLGVLVLFSLANSSDTFLLLRARDLGYSPWAVVMVYAFYNLFYSLLSYPAGVLSDRIGRWRIIIVGWFIYACVYAGFALLPSFASLGHVAAHGDLRCLHGSDRGCRKSTNCRPRPKQLPRNGHGHFLWAHWLDHANCKFKCRISMGPVCASAALLLGSGFAILAIVALVLVGKRAAPLRQLI